MNTIYSSSSSTNVDPLLDDTLPTSTPSKSHPVPFLIRKGTPDGFIVAKAAPSRPKRQILLLFPDRFVASRISPFTSELEAPSRSNIKERSPNADFWHEGSGVSWVCISD